MIGRFCYQLATFALSITPLWLSEAGRGQPLPCPAEQIQRIMPGGCPDSIFFGQSVAVEDDRMAVGRFDNPGGRVTTYVLNPLTRQWEFEADVVPPGLQIGEAFGHSVDLHYDAQTDRWLLAAGSRSRNTSEPRSGIAYVFALNAQGQWTHVADILSDPIVPYGWFGMAVEWVSADERIFLAVGASGSDSHGVIGSAYTFEEDAQGEWRQHTHLQAPDGTPEDAFGIALSSAENEGAAVLVVGASGHVNLGGGNTQPGAAYFYRFDEAAETWLLEAQFEAPDPHNQDEFGLGVAAASAIDLPGFSHRAAIGRPNEGGNGVSSGPGAVYLYMRAIDGIWLQEAHLQPPVRNEDFGEFGRHLHADKTNANRLLIGATNSRDFGPESGAAYVFERNIVSGNWLPTQGLWGREQDGYDGFAADLALGNGASADMAVVGALATQCPGGSQFDAVGAVYSFDLDPGEPGNCPPPVLTLQKVPDCAGGQGGEIEVRWFQATPDRRARIALLFGRRTGNFVIPDGNPCAGTRLGLGALDLQVAFTGSAGDFGAGRIVTTIPRAACGAYLQLVDISRCKTSNVVRIE